MSMLLVYLFITMDSLVVGVSVGFGCAALAVLIGLVCLPDAPTRAGGKKWLKWSLPAFILMGLLLIATPSTNQFAAIYLIPKIANHEDVKAISGDALKMLRIKFDAYINSIDPAKEIVKTAKEEETG